jgi:phage shock protein A
MGGSGENQRVKRKYTTKLDGYLHTIRILTQTIESIAGRVTGLEHGYKEMNKEIKDVDVRANLALLKAKRLMDKVERYDAE